MIQDLHSHTYYSFDSADSIEQVAETAIGGGIGLLGITDHNYGVGCARTEFLYHCGYDPYADYGRTLIRYHDHVKAVAQKYADRIKILSGIEICTLAHEHSYALPRITDVSFFDYCLVENLDSAESITGGDIIAFAQRTRCPTGIAHTDLFAFARATGKDPKEYFRALAEAGVFWEMNVNYDSIHGYRQHSYVKEFFASEEQQEIVRESGLKLSVGFDGHRTKDYAPDRVKKANELIDKAGIQKVFG